LAIVQRMRSDLTGVEDDPEKFGSFIIRRGPGIEKAIVWDVLPEEIGDLDAAPDVYVVEYRAPGAMNGEEIVCTLKELAKKVVPDGKTLDELTDAARSLRGRRPGTRNV
jgi:hypothetical protein